MTFTVQHIRSSEANRRPDPVDLVNGQLAVNYNSGNPGLYFKTDTQGLIKVGPTWIGDNQPTLTNYLKYSVGEQWLDTSGSSDFLYVWDGQEWRGTGLNNTTSIIPEDGYDCSLTLGDPTHRWGDVYACNLTTWGDFIPGQGDCAQDLGEANNRWGTLYACDIQLDNHFTSPRNCFWNLGDETHHWGTLYACSIAPLDDSLLPKQDGEHDLGSLDSRWENLWVNTVHTTSDFLPQGDCIQNLGNPNSKKWGDAFLCDLHVYNDVRPVAMDANSLGTPTQRWSNAYLSDIEVHNNIKPPLGDTYTLGELAPAHRWKNIYTNGLELYGDLRPPVDDTYYCGKDNHRWYKVHTHFIQVDSDIVPPIDHNYNLGSDSHRWDNIYTWDINVKGDAVPADDCGSQSLGTSLNKWGNAYLCDIELHNDLVPPADCTFALGSTTNKYKDAYLCDLHVYNDLRPPTTGGWDLGTEQYKWGYLYVNGITSWEDILPGQPNLNLGTSTDPWGHVNTDYLTVGNSIMPSADCGATLGLVNQKWGNAFLCELEVYNDIKPPTSNAGYTLGTDAKRWAHVYSDHYNVFDDFHPYVDASQTLGTEAKRWKVIYGNDLNINDHLTPDIDNVRDLGTPALRWRKIHMGEDDEGGNWSGNLVPTETCSVELGNPNKRWDKLYLCPMDLDSNGITPVSTGSISLGSTALRWEDLFTNNGTVTHNLTVGSGCSDKLLVDADAHFKCDVRIDGDLNMPGGGIDVDGGNVTLNQNCSDKTTIKGVLETNCEVTLNKTQGNTTAMGQLTVKKETTLDKTLYVGGTTTVKGNVMPQSTNSHNLGSNSTRWANLYTNDLDLSNEGSINDVDGTWGSYLIQEGEEDLFIINRRNGKKYKFHLIEVA